MKESHIKTTILPIEEILLKFKNERKCGEVVFSFDKCELNLTEITQKNGLLYSKTGLHEIGYQEAFNIVFNIMSQSLAYNTNLNPQICYLIEVDDLFIQMSRDAKFYTNSVWVNKKINTYEPLTEHTFDSGIIMISNSLSICFWVAEDA